MNSRVVLRYYSLRLDNLLQINGMKRLLVPADGNCFLAAVLKGISFTETDLNPQNLRKKLVNHIRANKNHYKIFVSFSCI